MYKPFIIFFLLIGSTIVAADLMEGKRRTSLTVELGAVLFASPERVFELCITEKPVRPFLPLKASMGIRPGESYEMIFAPDQDPDGSVFGTKGVRLLKMEKPRKLAVEGKTFVLPPDFSFCFAR